MKKAIVFGAGGFIGHHLIGRLKKEGYFVRGVDLKHPEFQESLADEFIIGDLRDPQFVTEVIDRGVDELYQLAAEMGGAGYLFTGENDADVMHNSALINLNLAPIAVKQGVKKVFFSSSACIYPIANQTDPDNPNCAEDSAYPAEPDSEYGWEKLFSERMFLAFRRNYGIDVRVARFHNIYGPYGTWNGGREKAPAAICRKVAEAAENSFIKIWGDGLQTRSFLYIDDCLDAIRKLMDSGFAGPVNIGSEEMISIRDFAKMVIGISGKTLSLHHIEGPIGVRGRTSDNKLIREKVEWEPSISLRDGITQTFNWINEQVELSRVRR